MKQSELRAVAKCANCGNGIAASGVPLFYLVTIERYGLKGDAIRRQAGLEQMLGNTSLAAVMGPDEDMAQQIGGKATFSICEACAMDHMPVAVLFDNKQP